jgi:hypothetical protein
VFELDLIEFELKRFEKIKPILGQKSAERKTDSVEHRDLEKERKNN